jgi:hypothetical protein
MDRNPLPYPPQMGNGGSPPAHLPSSSLSEPEVWSQIKWSQPPPRAPSPLLTWEEWQQEDERRCRQYEQAACDRRLKTARLLQILAKYNARYSALARQEDERCRQQLLDEQTARARQQAAAACQEAAAARQEAAAACARQEAADARAREALALDMERHCHEAVLAAEADNRRCREAAARAAEALALDKECCHHEAATRALLSTVSPLADERSCHKAATRATELAKLALAVRPRS